MWHNVRKPRYCALLLVVFVLSVSFLISGTIKYTYDSAGRLTGVDYGAGVTIGYSYDGSGNLVNQVVSNPAGFSFPFYQADSAGFTGFAVSNISDRVARLNFTAFGQDGSLLAFANNPKTFSLDPGKQLALLSHEIFGIDPSTKQNGWLKLTSDNAEIGSFFLTGSGTQLDGSVALTQQSRKFYFSRVLVGPTAFRGQAVVTFLSIANPNDQSIAIKLTLYGPQPNQVLAQKTESIPPRGFILKSLSQLFGQAISVSSGFLDAEVTLGEGAVGFELVQLPARNSIIGLNASVGNSANQSFSAQLANGLLAPGFSIFTDLKLVNVSGQKRTVIIKGVSESGSVLGAPVTTNLEPGQVLQTDAGQLLGLGANTTAPAVAGSIQVEADGPGVIGDVMFGDAANFNYAAALPLQTLTFTKAVFSQVANASGFFTGLALYNPGNATAAVTIEVFSAEGVLAGSLNLSLEGGKRLSKLVTELVPSSAGQARGYILIRSNQPLIAQQLFGDSNLNFLSAVPPTILQ